MMTFEYIALNVCVCQLKRPGAPYVTSSLGCGQLGAGRSRTHDRAGESAA